MSDDSKPILGQLQFEHSTPSGARETRIVENTAFYSPLILWISTLPGQGDSPLTAPPKWVFIPWKSRSGYPVGPGSVLTNISHGYMGSTGDVNQYPSFVNAAFNTAKYNKFRQTPATLNFSQANQSRVIGAVGAVGGYFYEQGENSILSLTEIPLDITSIGPVYIHPPYTSSVTVTSGQAWVQLTSTGFYSGHYPWYAGKLDFVRIETGADKGMYRVSSEGTANGKLFLTHLDGTAFSGQATATVTATFSHRRAYYNEAGVIWSGLGGLTISGKYQPGDVRDSYQLRIIFEKNGTTVAGDQQGSYYFSLKPYTHNDSDWVTGSTAQGSARQNPFIFVPGSTWYYLPLYDYNFEAGNGGTGAFGGGVNGYAYDQVSNRLWWILEKTASGGSSLVYWNWRTAEGWREVADGSNTPANPGELSPAVTLAKVLRGIDIGSDGTIYVTGFHTTGGFGGLTMVKRDLTTQQWTTTTGTPNFFPFSTAGAGVVDKSRYRSFANIDTTVLTDTIEDIAGTTFTQSDVGRAFKVNSGDDAGTYLISVVTDNNTIQVTTMAGGAVSFAGSTGVTGQIGDRIYLFNVTAPGYTAGKLLYMESLAPGYFLEKTPGSMTNGRQYAGISVLGMPQKACVDQRNGNLYYISADTQAQVNKYDPTTNTFSFRTTTNLTTPAGSPTGSLGSGVNFLSLSINEKFDELWIGGSYGHVRIDVTDFTSTTLFRRYFGRDDSTTSYQNPAGVYHRSGDNSVNNADIDAASCYMVGPDGKMYATQWSAATNGPLWTTLTIFNRESDSWQSCLPVNGSLGSDSTYLGSGICMPDGWIFALYPFESGTTQEKGVMFPVEVDYQWIGSAWVPKQVVRNSLPNFDGSDTICPGLQAKPLHSAAADLIYGVKVAFTPQGGAAPPNNEFLGRAGVVKPTAIAAVRTDGATGAGDIFTGTSFQSTDEKKYLRLHGGTNVGVYIIKTFTNVTTVVLQKLNGAAFVGASESGLTYSVWDMGAAGTNAGIENATVLLADGLSKDSSQDLNGFNYEIYAQKVVVSDQAEAIKCCTQIIGPPGSVGHNVYHSFYAKAGSNWSPAEGAHKALEALVTDGNALTDGLIDKILRGTEANAAATQPLITAGTDNWYGTNPDSAVTGYGTSVDFGAAVEVGSVLMRFWGNQGDAPSYTMSVAVDSGLLGMLYNTNSTPVASSTVRFSGVANLSTTLNTTTISLTSGDFLSAVTVGPFSNGDIAQFGNTITAPASTFTGHDGKVLQITAGAAAGDLGYYRIVSVDGTGAIATIRSLDVSAKAWTATATGVTWQIYGNAVREEDRICIPNLGSATSRLVVERLLTTTTAQVRIPARATASAQSFDVIAPTWNVVKRLAHPVQHPPANPVEQFNNGTWMSGDGQEDFTHNAYKVFFDLSDLSSAQRTARYWKWTAMTRYAGATNAHRDWLCSFEFYTPAGKLIGATSYNRLDTVDSEPDFIFASVNRLDFIQSTSTAMGTGFNGNVDLGGTNGDVVTPTTGGNKFLGFQVRAPITDGVADVGTNTFNSATAAFDNSDIGRFIRLVTAPTNIGTYPYLRISSVSTPTQVIVTTPAGNAVAFAAESGITFTMHEGINTGVSTPDYINFGAVGSGNEHSILSVSDDLETITLNNPTFTSLSGVAFEIRRRALDYAAATPAPTASLTARIVRHELTTGSYPQQPGDVCCDTRGFLRFYGNDVGSGNQRTDGVTTISTGTFGGTGFCKDDEGRILHILTGDDKGPYKISTFGSSTSVTVVNSFTGAAVSFTNSESTLTYRIYGERRFRASRYVTGLRA
jgi:hypothetical protein